MSDLNLHLNMNVNKNSSGATWGDYAAGSGSSNNSSSLRIGQNEDEDRELNKSIFKSYLDSLRTKSDEQTQKLLKTLENSPADTVHKLFGNLQTKTVDGIGKLFDGLKIESADDLNKLMETLEAKQADKTDEVDKTDETDKTDRSDKSGQQESQLQKYIKRSTEKLSAENTTLDSASTQLAQAAQKLQEAFEPDEETGEIDTETAYNAANDFIKSYNSMADAVKDARSGTVSGKAEFISDMLDVYSRKLDKVGITKDENGELSVDLDKLEASSARDKERAFGKKDSFAEFIDGQARQMAAYARTDLYQRSSAYTDAGNITQVSNISGSYFNMLG